MIKECKGVAGNIKKVESALREAEMRRRVEVMIEASKGVAGNIKKIERGLRDAMGGDCR